MGEFETMRSGASLFIGLRGHINMEAVERGLAHMAAERDAFFNDLPEEELTPLELKLRAAILDFLKHWIEDVPPPYQTLCDDMSVARARKSLLPKGIPLHEWIDERIGGELEVMSLDGSSVSFVGKQGEIDIDAVRRGMAWLEDQDTGRQTQNRSRSNNDSCGRSRSRRRGRS